MRRIRGSLLIATDLGGWAIQAAPTAKNLTNVDGAARDCADRFRDEHLRQFLEDFLIPTTADGQLECREDTPVIFAYHAYRIDEMFCAHPQQLAELCKASIRQARFRPPADRRGDLAQAWKRIQTLTDGMAIDVINSLQAWFEREAETREVPSPRRLRGCAVAATSAAHASSRRRRRDTGS